MKQPVVLRVYKDEKLETVRQFESSQIVVGRTNESQLELRDDSVALLHAMIEDRGGGEYYISDLGSQSGTYIGGQRVLENKLQSGDEIKIGPFRIQFFVGVPKPASPPKAVTVEPVPEPTPVTTVSFVSTTREASRPAMPDSLTKVDKPSRKIDLPEAPKTFAPPSPYKNLNEIIKPGKGTVVEVMVAWQDRILSTNHFHHKGSVYISSSDDADVIVPIISSKSKYELLKIDANVAVCLTPEMTGELVRDGETLSFSELGRQNKMRNVGSHFELDLRQGEMVRVGLQNDMLSVYVRFVAETPKPLVAPLLDMTSSEVTGVILALAVAAILGLYMNIYTPSPLLEDEARVEEPIRKAIVTFAPPAPREEPKETPPPPEPPKKKIVEVKEQKQASKAKAQPQESKAFEQKPDPGKAAEVRPKPQSKNQPKKLTSAVPQGASIKTGNKEGANMKSEKPDPNKMGLLATFGKGGVQKDLSKAYSGSGELAGLADAATGAAGGTENRAGDTLGGKLKDTGAGGKGTATYGIAGVGTQGRGTGTTGYGTGGLGQKGSVQVNVGGQDADVTAGMDREAIRRVVREHLREIRTCYERELQRSPDLYGKIVLQWDIGEEGRVLSVKPVSNELGNASVANCIMSRLKTWKFPDPPKDVIGRVNYPFVFSSQ